MLSKGISIRFLIHSLFAILVFCTSARCQTGSRYGAYIGSFIPQGTPQVVHGVTGDVYAINNTHIWIRGFFYDGKAPDAHFYAGSSASPGPAGEIIPNEIGSTNPLGEYNNVNLVLQLPAGRTVGDYRWISVWCNLVLVNFAHVFIPSNFLAPAPVSLGSFGFNPRVHNVQAENVIIKNTKQFEFIRLEYDGFGPDAHFWTGSGNPSPSGILVYHESESRGKLVRFDRQNVTITLPVGYTVFDIDFIGMWCVAARQDFGHLFLPNALNVPVYLTDDDIQETDTGQLESDGFSITACDSTRTCFFFPEGCNPEIAGSCTHFASWKHSNDGTKLLLALYAQSSSYVAFGFSKSGGMSDSDVYACTVTGSVIRARNNQVGYSNSPRLLKGVSDANVAYSDGALRCEFSRDLLLYDGDEEFFDLTSDRTYTAIMSWNGGLTTEGALRYHGVNRAIGPVFNFAAPEIPDPITSFENCQVFIPDRFHASWTLKRDEGKVLIELQGRLDANEYMAFGISGSNARTQMVGSDVTVAWFDTNLQEARVVDYNLTARSQCVIARKIGACPDEITGGKNDANLLSYSLDNGVTKIVFERPIVATEVGDQNFPSNQYVYVSWALGLINADGYVSRHSVRTPGDALLFFGQTSSSCPEMTISTSPPLTDVEPWVIPPFEPEGDAVFEVIIGPAGGKRGYEGIAGQVGWGFVWYVNGTLLPEITIKRGSRYRFVVRGGNDGSTLASYHPFYITDDRDGGYYQKTFQEQQEETVYAGPTIGALCEWTSTVDPEDFETFEEFRSRLTLNCPQAGLPGILEWIPDKYTPDLVYYQCYVHKFFGWRINVIDEDVTVSPPTTSATTQTTTATATTQTTTTVAVPFDFVQRVRQLLDLIQRLICLITRDPYKPICQQFF